MPRHLRTWMSVYITSVYNILYGTRATGKFCACMHMFCIYSQNTCVWRGEGSRSVCAYTCLCALWLNHKLNMGSPGSFWSFWPFSTSARKRERRDKEEMFRISTGTRVIFTLRGGGELRVVIHHHVTLSKNLLGRFQLQGVRFLGNRQTSQTYNKKQKHWNISLWTGNQNSDKMFVNKQTKLRLSYTGKTHKQLPGS